jgi:hypothetical protein
VKDILERKIYKFYFRMSNSKLPAYFTDTEWLVEQSGTHTYNTRIVKFKIPRIHHKFAENSLKYKLPILLNTNETHIIEKVHTHNEQGFSIYVKNDIISKYSEHCSITNCYICNNLL